MKSKKEFGNSFLLMVFTFTIFLLLGSNNFSNQYKISNSVMSEMNIRTNDERILLWIEFTDKGSNIDYKLSHPESYPTLQSVERRKKVKPFNALADYTDIPLNNNYIVELQNAGIEIKNKSKWSNQSVLVL